MVIFWQLGCHGISLVGILEGKFLAVAGEVSPPNPPKYSPTKILHYTVLFNTIILSGVLYYICAVSFRNKLSVLYLEISIY